MKKKIIVCSLKHSAHINKIIEKIQNSKYANDYSLFIDDEGDDISQNTSTEKFKYDINGIPGEYKRSKNNEKIVNLKTTLKKSAFITLTATPEAPILLQDFQALSPDYCVTLEPGEEYTGLITFHSAESPYVQKIDDYECLLDENKLKIHCGIF